MLEMIEASRRYEVAGRTVHALDDVTQCFPAGTITAINSDLVSSPEAVNQDAYAAWLFKMKPAKAADLDTLLDAAAYTSVSME